LLDAFASLREQFGIAGVWTIDIADVAWFLGHGLWIRDRSYNVRSVIPVPGALAERVEAGLLLASSSFVRRYDLSALFHQFAAPGNSLVGRVEKIPGFLAERFSHDALLSNAGRERNRSLGHRRLRIAVADDLT
jgi:hypothetical protein